MKRIFNITLCILMVALIFFTLLFCGEENTSINLWENAIYTVDTEFGDGEKTVTVEVIANDKSVNFIINTDKQTLGEALLEHNLISGEKGAYGLYIKAVNGITADYDIDKSYWSLSKDGEAMMTGVDGAEISDEDHYEITYIR